MCAFVSIAIVRLLVNLGEIVDLIHKITDCTNAKLLVKYKFHQKCAWGMERLLIRENHDAIEELLVFAISFGLFHTHPYPHPNTGFHDPPNKM